MNTPNYTFHVGEKFHTDGSVRTWPGVTVICFTDPNSAIYRIGERIQGLARELPYGHKFAMLPPSSFHMTVFSLIGDQSREADYWSSQLPLDIPLAEADEFFLRTVPPVPAPENFRMLFTYLGGGALTMRLNPADERSYYDIWNYRDALAQASGVKYPDHDRYLFHMTLAYVLEYLTPDEEQDYEAFRMRISDEVRSEIGIFDTGRPHLTFFDDMYRFVVADERHTLSTRS